MSFNHLWFSCLLSQADEQYFQPMFAEAQKKAILSSQSEEALQYWQSNLDRFTIDWLLSVSLEERKIHGEWYNRFVWAFNLPGYTELAAEIASFLSEETCFRYISIGGCSPVAVLWQAIGRERALLLPGTMGNVFLTAKQIASAAAQTKNALRDLAMNEAVTRGVALVGESDSEDSVRSIITHFPEGLQRAIDTGRGFMALARPQL